MTQPFDVTTEDFTNRVLNADKPVVVDFWAEWCGPCLMMAPVLDELADELADRVFFAKVNVDDTPGLAMEYGVSGIPTLIVFKDGKEAGRLVGFAPGPSVRSTLEEILSENASIPVPG